MVSTFLIRPKVDLRRTFYLERETPGSTWFCESVFNLCIISDALRYDMAEVENRLYAIKLRLYRNEDGKTLSILRAIWDYL